MRNGLTNRNALVREESVIAQGSGDRRTGDGRRGDGEEVAGRLTSQIGASAFFVGEDGLSESQAPGRGDGLPALEALAG